MKVILYSTGCPKCEVLEKKLNNAGITYDKCNDIDVMTKLGIQRVPVLSVDEKLYEFSEANIWINSYDDHDGRCSECKSN